MFEEVFLYEGEKPEATNEDEFFGNVAPDKHIRLPALLGWMKKVGASENAKFLKCLNYKSKGVEVNNIVDVTFSANLIHKDVTFANGVKIAFKEGEDIPAMTLAYATELFSSVAAKCEEEGISLDDVEVFVEDEKGKLTQFCWYYDTDTDTACIVKNMNPRMAARFMHGAEELIVKAAKTPRTPDRIIDELSKIEEQMKRLKDRQDAVYKKLEDFPASA